MSGNKNKQKQLAKKREKRRVKRLDASRQKSPSKSSVDSSSMEVPTKFSVKLGPLLERAGPLVVAEWAVPKSLEEQLKAEGKPIPSPVVGYVLVDTGAGKTGIAQHSAEHLGLAPLGTSQSFGAHGAQESIRYKANFTLRINDLKGKLLSVSFEEHEVLGIPKMKESFDQFGIRDHSGNPINVIGVLGREFLRHTRLVYDGPQGMLHFEIDTSSIHAAKRSGLPVPKIEVK